MQPQLCSFDKHWMQQFPSLGSLQIHTSAQFSLQLEPGSSMGAGAFPHHLRARPCATATTAAATTAPAAPEDHTSACLSKLLLLLSPSAPLPPPFQPCCCCCRCRAVLDLWLKGPPLPSSTAPVANLGVLLTLLLPLRLLQGAAAAADVVLLAGPGPASSPAASALTSSPPLLGVVSCCSCPCSCSSCCTSSDFWCSRSFSNKPCSGDNGGEVDSINVRLRAFEQNPSLHTSCTMAASLTSSSPKDYIAC